MKAPDLILRCYAKREEDRWVAVCIDLCLAAQGDSLEEAKKKLRGQIREYVEDALTVDNQFAENLLTRKAPIAQRIEYASIIVMHKLHLLRGKISRRATFSTTLPVHAGGCCHA